VNAMETPNDNGLPREQVQIAKRKKDPVGKFFLSVKKDFKKGLDKIKTSWDKMINNIKENDPKRKRFKRLYGKLEEMETQLAEIKDDTDEIKLKIDDVTDIVHKLMEEINDVEEYMKENLGSDWKILKNSWKRCKKGEISKKEFIKIGLTKVGKRFASIFINM
jgi:predicted nuclease with TOPRIM domain